MLCDKGKLTDEKSSPCKYFVSRTYFTECGGQITEMFCNNGELYGFAEDNEDMSMIRLIDKTITKCSNYKPKVNPRTKKKAKTKKTETVNQKKG
jgi:hypothetical protein